MHINTFTVMALAVTTARVVADTNNITQPIKAAIAFSLPALALRPLEENAVTPTVATDWKKPEPLWNDYVDFFGKEQDGKHRVKELPELKPVPEETGLGIAKIGPLELGQGPVPFFDALPDPTRVTPSGEALNPYINPRVRLKKLELSRLKGLTYVFSSHADVSIMEEKDGPPVGFGLMILFTWYDK